MIDHRIQTHTLVSDSYGDPLVTPLKVEIRKHTDCIVLVMHADDGTEVASVHLEVDAGRGHKVVLRAWDSSGEEYDGVPVVEHELILSKEEIV